MEQSQVFLAMDDECSGYPNEPPFRAGMRYPELNGKAKISRQPNDVYALLRNLLHQMGLDGCNFSTPQWNPFGEIIQPGQKVLLKPNLVRHYNASGGELFAVITHPSVVRCIADYVALALRGRGEIVIGDAPVQSADFDVLVEKTSLDQVAADVAECWGVPVRLTDMRLWQGKGSGIGRDLVGDEDGYCRVDLAKRSMLEPFGAIADRFRVTCYDSNTMRQHHDAGRHQYVVAKAVLSSDVIINLPKLKTHGKVGVTIALKNLVGINGHKDCLPHHRAGSTCENGDEYLHPSRLKRLRSQLDEANYRRTGSKGNHVRRFAIRVLGRLIKYFAKDPFTEGSWYGNDTCWRMALDLNRILRYADQHGHVTKKQQRKLFIIVDGIIAGEGDGPLAPDARVCNLVAGGLNPVAIDATLTTVIGFDYRQIPLIFNAFSAHNHPLVGFQADKVTVHSDDQRFRLVRVGEPYTELSFKPPSGWTGHVEWDHLSSTNS